jgi:hypothetical protein
MIVKKYYAITAAVLCVLILVSAPAAAQVNIHELNGSDLGMGVGARSIAMSGAFTALADDASALYWNPAGITQLERTEAMMMMDVNPTRYSYKALVLRPKKWKESDANWAFGIGRTNRLKYIADGDWSQGNASHLIDLSMINVERTYVGGLNSRTKDWRFTLAGNLPTHPNLKIGATYIDFKCVTTFYGAGAGRICQTVAYDTMDFGLLYQDREDMRLGLSFRNPLEDSKPRYINLGAAWFRGRDTFTLDFERIFGNYSGSLRQVRFFMIRSGVERDLQNGWKVRGGLVIPLQAWTSTLGNIRDNLPSPGFGGSVGAGYTWNDTTLDFAVYGDPGKSYVQNKKKFASVFTLRQKF